ncbi:MAG: lytic transglycosylase domain-containing protein [Mycobacterium leprae]
MSPAQGFYKVLAGFVILVVGLVPTYQRTTQAALSPSSAAKAEGYSLAIDKEWTQDVRAEVRRKQAAERKASELAAQEQQERYQTIQWAHQRAVERSRAQQQLEDLVPADFRPLILDVAVRFGLDSRLLAAICQVESQWRTNAQGSHGEIGLMQLTPGTAAWIAGQLGLSTYDLGNPNTNLTMGAWYLRWLYRQYGNWSQALAVYNGGPAAATLAERHPYVKRVMALYE